MALNPPQVATLQNNYIFFACCRFVRSADLLHRDTGAQLEGSRSDLEPWGAAASPGRGERRPGASVPRGGHVLAAGQHVRRKRRQVMIFIRNAAREDDDTIH